MPRQPVIPIWIQGVEVPCIEYSLGAARGDSGRRGERRVLEAIYSWVDRNKVSRCFVPRGRTTRETHEAVTDGYYRGDYKWHFYRSVYKMFSHLHRTRQLVRFDRSFFWDRHRSPDPLLLPSTSRIRDRIIQLAEAGRHEPIITLAQVQADPSLIHDSLAWGEFT